MNFIRRKLPHSDLTVLVRGENHSIAETDGLDGTGGGVLTVKGVEMFARVTIIDVYFIG